MRKKKAAPNTSRRPRTPKSTPAQKRESLIASLLSVDELGQVTGGFVCRCQGECETA